MTADTPFTREMALTMSPDEIRAFWQERQRARRHRGEQHYTMALDAASGAVVFTIDGER